MRPLLAALDTLLDHRVRLAICVLLSRYDRLSFSRLKELTAETDGSLGAHLRRLEDEGYVPAGYFVGDQVLVSPLLEGFTAPLATLFAGPAPAMSRFARALTPLTTLTAPCSPAIQR